MKKLLLTTLILSSGLMFAPVVIPKNKPAAPNQKASQAQPQPQAQPQVQPQQQAAKVTTNPYMNDLDTIEKELQLAVKNGSANPTEAEENALKDLDQKLNDFITQYCPQNSNNEPHNLNNEITLENACKILDKFEIVAQKLFEKLSKNDWFLAICVSQYSTKRKQAYDIIEKIQTIKEDINPSNFIVKKFYNAKKWAFLDFKNLAATAVAAAALSAGSRFIFKERNGWIKPTIDTCSTIVSRTIVPVFKFITWQ